MHTVYEIGTGGDEYAPVGKSLPPAPVTKRIGSKKEVVLPTDCTHGRDNKKNAFVALSKFRGRR